MNLEIATLPKVEMHLHLEGALRPGTYVELRTETEPDYVLEQSPWHDPDYRFESLDHFLDTATPSPVRTPEHYYRAAAELFQDMLEQNVIYTEITIASRRIPIPEIARAIHRAWRKTVPDGALAFGALIGLFRSGGPELAAEMVRQGIEAREWGVVGVDLLEREAARPAGAFKNVFAMAAEAGLGLRAHAGEGAGPDSVWDVVNSLRVPRIAHGTRAVEDEGLLRHLIENGIALDMCPTSNHKLSVVRSFEDHPIRRLFDLGAKVTVSSDDPLFFGSDLTGELTKLHDVFRFSTEELLQLARNAIDTAFLGRGMKDKLHQALSHR